MQSIASKRQGVSVVPVAFWYLSLAGATLLLLYSIYRRDPVFILGQCFGFFVYTRNLIPRRLRTDSARWAGES